MHVRVCVECGEEYRPEIAVCADCGGRLEDRQDDGERTVLSATPPDESAPGREAEFTETLFHAKTATDLTEEADRLVEAGIEVRLRAAPEGGFRLLVTAPDLDRALALLGLLADGSERSGDCPACGTKLPAAAVECPECGLAAGDEPDPD
jgi:uncharacterized OB-fold protein